MAHWACGGAFYHRWERAIAGVNASAKALRTFLRDAVERLADALERERVGGLGAPRGGRLDHQVGALAHGVDQLRFVGGGLQPGAVVLGVERERGAADRQAGVSRGLEGVI